MIIIIIYHVGAIALFPQKGSIDSNKLEPEIKKKAENKFVFYNKGI